MPENKKLTGKTRWIISLPPSRFFLIMIRTKSFALKLHYFQNDAAKGWKGESIQVPPHTPTFKIKPNMSSVYPASAEEHEWSCCWTLILWLRLHKPAKLQYANIQTLLKWVCQKVTLLSSFDPEREERGTRNWTKHDYTTLETPSRPSLSCTNKQSVLYKPRQLPVSISLYIPYRGLVILQANDKHLWRSCAFGPVHSAASGRLESAWFNAGAVAATLCSMRLRLSGR